MLLLEAGELIEQPADLRIGEPVVRDASERGELLGSNRRSARRHHRLLVPVQDRAGVRDFGELGQAAAELVECRSSRAARYRTAGTKGNSYRLQMTWKCKAPVRYCKQGHAHPAVDFRPHPPPTVRRGSTGGKVVPRNFPSGPTSSLAV